MDEPKFELEKFSRLNYERCVEFHQPGVPEDWSLSEWSNAVAGEVGEVCGVAKKILRIDHNIHNEKKSREDLLEDLGEEIADVFIYLDILATVAGIDIGNAIVKKFNKKSREKEKETFYR